MASPSRNSRPIRLPSGTRLDMPMSAQLVGIIETLAGGERQ
ncbi:hypothetical protein QCE62_25100 [Caballeronia sp. LZ033]|nr:hypothetical protein [Caballeronia sp. LZ033]MDR5816880.1 hypothetical protein [Caballeronia sp. LZ033]